MNFIDTTEFNVSAGDGGHGIVCFRRGRHRPKAGADGGNGGRGGHVFFVGDLGRNTLSHLRYRAQYRAEPGGRGGANDRTGAQGEDLLIPVPVGTIVHDAATDRALGEVVCHGERLLIAEGGSGGFGNARFVTSTRQAPDFRIEGREGHHVTLRLELKLLADIGLAGLPNAGKSSLLSCMSSARPKVADYPFTTLVPQLGVVDMGGRDGHWDSFVIADVPGLVEGAAMGRGLGHDFLRHLERARVVAYVVDAFSDEMTAEAALTLLRQEMQAFNPEFVKRERIVVLNKMDLASSPEQRREVVERLGKHTDLAIACISCATGEGMPDLKRHLHELLQEGISTGISARSETGPDRERVLASGRSLATVKEDLIADYLSEPILAMD